MIAGAGYEVRVDAKIFYRQRLNSGQMEKPKFAYVPANEKYNMNDPKNALRELFGRHRCPACGKAFFLRESAFDCHPEASAYKVWNKFAYAGQAGARSLEDAIRAEIANPYGAFGPYSGGPYGL